MAGGPALSRRGLLLGSVALAGCSGLSGFASAPAPFQPAAAGPPGRWAAYLPGSRQTVDHRIWDSFLVRYRRVRSDGVALLPYGEITQAEQELLDGYLSSLAAVRVSTLDRPEQLAFWLNLHNALVVRLVTRHYLVLSVRDIDPSGGGPWGRPIVEVEGVRLSLADIRDRILRGIWHDARLHYGFNYGAVGSPSLPARAFAGADVDLQLDQLALEFVNHPRAVWIDKGNLVLSSLYDWFAADFGGPGAPVLAHLRLYAAADLRPWLSPDARVDFAFDWSLNDSTGSLG